MVYLISQRNSKLNSRVLDRMYRMRHKVAVEHWGWRIPSACEGVDKDEFDTLEALHFVKIADDGCIHGCARLLPTTLPHMLSEVFPDACDRDGVPVGPDIYEFSRFFVDKTMMSRRDYIKTGYELLAAIAEWSFANGVRQLSWYSFQVTYGLALPLWTTKPLGSPKTHEGDESVYVPAISNITAEAVARTRSKAQVTGAAFKFVSDIDWSLSDEAA